MLPLSHWTDEHGAHRIPAFPLAGTAMRFSVPACCSFNHHCLLRMRSPQEPQIPRDKMVLLKTNHSVHKYLWFGFLCVFSDSNRNGNGTWAERQMLFWGKSESVEVPAWKGIKVVCFGSLVQIWEKQRLWIRGRNSDGQMLAYDLRQGILLSSTCPRRCPWQAVQTLLTRPRQPRTPGL